MRCYARQDRDGRFGVIVEVKLMVKVCLDALVLMY